MPYVPDRSVGAAQQRGFSLIEAMFSALILAIALLGLAGFQVAAMSDASLVKARSVAANLAQEKLDDLRGFTHVADDPSTTTVNECAAPTFCFSEIADDAGGAEKSGGALVLPSGAVAGYLDSYSIAWDVTCSTETAGSALSFGASCTDAVAKLATVTVSWTDSKGAGQTVSLQGVIYAMDPARMAGGLTRSFSSARPVASYTPIGVPDAVPVPIDTGTGEHKESSKPVPEVSTQGIAAEVSFDAVSYVSNGTGYEMTQAEEFLTVACECAFNGTGTTGRAPSRMIWNGTELEAKVGDEVSKTVGVPADSNQSDHCTACCKDHHDVAGQAKYDPDPDREYTGGGDHKHYWYTLCTSGTTGSTSGCNAAKKDLLATGNGYSEVLSGAYLESCRFKRVDGFWRVWQDWRQVKMTVVPYDYLQNSSKLDAYVGMIVAAVENTIRTDSGNGSTTVPSLNDRDISFGSIGQVKQLLSRAVYVDRIYQADDPTALDTGYYAHLVDLIDDSDDWLNIVPFYEVNLTLLTEWSSDMPTKASVTSQTIVNIGDVSGGYYNSYSRGKVTALASGSETPSITAISRLHNTGVTGGINYSSPIYGISDYDNTWPSSEPSHSILVTLPGSSSSLSISGKFIRANVSANFSTLQVSGVTCEVDTFTGGNELAYSCPVTSGSNVTLAYSSSASGYSFSPDSQTFEGVTDAQVAGNVTVYGPTVEISGSITSSGGGKLTAVTATPGSCAILSGGKSYTCTVPNSAAGYSGTITFTGDSPSPSTQEYSGQKEDVPNLDVSVSK